MKIGALGKVYDIIAQRCGSRLVERPTVISVFGDRVTYVPKTKQLQKDIFISSDEKIKNSVITADNSLFSWAKRRPTLSMNEVKPESLVMVHRTKYFPKGGKIISTNMATKNADGVGECRHTIHFALNKSVTEHFFGNKWNDMEYSIILPFRETVEKMPSKKVIGGIQDDFFFLDEVKLPKGSVIIKQNPNVADGIYKISDVFDGVKLVETSSSDMVKTTDNIIRKMGFSTYNDVLHKHLELNDIEFAKLISQQKHSYKKT